MINIAIINDLHFDFKKVEPLIIYEKEIYPRYIPLIKGLFNNRCVVDLDTYYFGLSTLCPEAAFMLRDTFKSGSLSVKVKKLICGIISDYKKRCELEKEVFTRPNIVVEYISKTHNHYYLRSINEKGFKRFVAYIKGYCKLSKEKAYEMYKTGLKKHELTLQDDILGEGTAEILCRMMNKESLQELITQMVQEYRYIENVK